MINGDVFFAAANGYDGFISYFEKIFDPRDFARIYILKGGPGTGKSSLMRKISREISSKGGICESILCSSDKDSLDGIICTNNEAKIAIIDGTAPHERDPQLPGTKDELINLGDHWDKRWLCAKQNEILELNLEKKNAYRKAALRRREKRNKPRFDLKNILTRLRKDHSLWKTNLLSRK